MNLRPMRPNEVAKHHFVPQAIVNRPVSFFVSSGVSFRKGHDDLDEYEVAELELENGIPFALLRYKGTPENETTIFLPDEYSLSRTWDLVQRIAAEFSLTKAAIQWHRERSDTPF